MIGLADAVAGILARLRAEIEIDNDCDGEAGGANGGFAQNLAGARAPLFARNRARRTPRRFAFFANGSLL